MKYALHPGWITSKTDGQQHYIGVAQLAALYELRPEEYFIWNGAEGPGSRGSFGKRWEDYIHLYPDYDGNYGRPDA